VSYQFLLIGEEIDKYLADAKIHLYHIKQFHREVKDATSAQLATLTEPMLRHTAELSMLCWLGMYYICWLCTRQD
jgi:uncharacterized membrane protein (DUF106 family)